MIMITSLTVVVFGVLGLAAGWLRMSYDPQVSPVHNVVNDQ